MSGSSHGPVSHLPGHVLRPVGEPCDQHPDRVSTHRVCTEADSFGAEYTDMCDECYTEHVAVSEANRLNEETCEACGCMKTDVRPIRDPDEGSAGPVYYRCGECREELLEYHRKHAIDYDIADDEVADGEFMDRYPEDPEVNTDQILEEIEDNDEDIG